MANVGSISLPCYHEFRALCSQQKLCESNLSSLVEVVVLVRVEDGGGVGGGGGGWAGGACAIVHVHVLIHASLCGCQ